MTSYRLGTPYEQALFSRVQGADLGVTASSSNSGYYNKPADSLDPNLIGPDGKLLPAVRSTVLGLLYTFWDPRYNDPHAWSTVWIAGSALSWQWAERGLGDLDTLIGVNMILFKERNPQFAGWTEEQIADHFNNEFRHELDPLTAEFPIGGESFEITFYVNPGAQDIRDINPYAAFNLTVNEWTVNPITVPLDWDPTTYFPQEWWDDLNAEISEAASLAAEATALRERFVQAEGPERVNLAAQMRTVVDRGSSLFDSIHSGRKNAFSATGAGYFDFYNLRWQAHKHAGTIKALHSLKSTQVEAKHDAQQELYGVVLDGVSDLAARAMVSQNPDWYKRHLG